MDEFESGSFQAQDDDIRTDGRLTRERRARQVAIDVGQPFDWDHQDIEVLTEVFVQYGWSAARQSIEKLLGDGISPDELRLVMAVRELWQESGVFPYACIDFARHGAGDGMISWSNALALVRLFSGIPDLSEIGCYLESRFENWRNDTMIHRQFPVFSAYLNHCISSPEEDADASYDWSPAEEEYFWSDSDPADTADFYLRDIMRGD